MKFEEGKYYHLYNRSNNREIVFREEENYRYFIVQYQRFMQEHFTTYAFCLMPNHFHFLVKSTTSSPGGNGAIGLLLSAYAKAINKRYERQGSLFQPHTKAKEITDERYLTTLITYIHQNPVRAHLSTFPEEWPYSSFHRCVGKPQDFFIDISLLFHHFKDFSSYAQYSSELLIEIKKEFWI